MSSEPNASGACWGRNRSTRNDVGWAMPNSSGPFEVNTSLTSVALTGEAMASAARPACAAGRRIRPGADRPAPRVFEAQDVGVARTAGVSWLRGFEQTPVGALHVPWRGTRQARCTRAGFHQCRPRSGRCPFACRRRRRCTSCRRAWPARTGRNTRPRDAGRRVVTGVGRRAGDRRAGDAGPLACTCRPGCTSRRRTSGVVGESHRAATDWPPSSTHQISWGTAGDRRAAPRRRFRRSAWCAHRCPTRSDHVPS